MDRERILREIRRTAEANGGKPPGYRTFTTRTGVGMSDWSRYWPNWSDALRDAGYEPNRPLDAFTDEYLIEHLIALTRKLGHWAVWREWRIERYNNPGFPNEGTFRKLGTTQDAAQRVYEYVKARDGYDDVLPLIEAAVKPRRARDVQGTETRGVVYLIKSGRTYKIGKTGSMEGRSRQFAIQLPHPHVIVHKLETDDIAGIEAYWHRRFEGKRLGTSEWFALNADDVKAFQRRRKYM